MLSKLLHYSFAFILFIGIIDPTAAQVSKTCNDSIYTLPGEEIAKLADKYLFKKTPQEDLYLYLLRPSEKTKKLLP